MYLKNDFTTIFEYLKEILKPYALNKLSLKMDNQNIFYLDDSYSEK